MTFGEQVLEAVRRRSSEVQAEAFLTFSETRELDWSEGRPENTAISRSERSGSFAFFSEISPSMVRWNSQIR